MAAFRDETSYPRERTIGNLGKLQQSVVATTDETLAPIRRARLHDFGCGAIDVALLASALLAPDAVPWTLDCDLVALATRPGAGFET